MGRESMEGGIERALEQTHRVSSLPDKAHVFHRNGWVFSTRNRVDLQSRLTIFFLLILLIFFPQVVASVYKF